MTEYVVSADIPRGIARQLEKTTNLTGIPQRYLIVDAVDEFIKKYCGYTKQPRLTKIRIKESRFLIDNLTEKLNIRVSGDNHFYLKQIAAYNKTTLKDLTATIINEYLELNWKGDSFSRSWTFQTTQ